MSSFLQQYPREEVFDGHVRFVSFMLCWVSEEKFVTCPQSMSDELLLRQHFVLHCVLVSKDPSAVCTPYVFSER